MIVTRWNTVRFAPGGFFDLGKPFMVSVSAIRYMIVHLNYC